MNTYQEPSREIPIVRDVDVVVVGGGPAGLAAAIASGRNGASTVLIERFGYLGGTATASLMACLCGFRNPGKVNTTQQVRGIAEEIVLKLKDMGGLGTAPYERSPYPCEPGLLEYSYAIDLEKFKFLVLRMCVDAQVDLMLHTYFCDTILEDGHARGVIVENKSGRQAVMGQVIVDATGDADVSARAGVPFWQTKKSESPRLRDTLMYRIIFGDHRPPGVFSVDFDSTAVLWGPTLEGVDGADGADLSRAEIEARLGVFKHFEELQTKVNELSTAKVLETPPHLGVRQSRFVRGDYVLCADDVIEGRRFPDAIAVCAHPFEAIYGYRRYLDHEGYDIPYRCLLPQKVEGLLVAGRCISCTQEAFESFRAMAPIMAIGEAAGTAAAMCCRQGVSPRQLNARQLQGRLMAKGAFLRPGEED